jgi:hypothetical protein
MLTTVQALRPVQMRAETPRQRLMKLGVQLKDVRTSYEAHWRELAEHYAPRRTRFFEQDRNRGDKRYNKIINETGMLAARTLRAGMMAGITSPARPWRRLSTPDPEMADYPPVKEWLDLVNKRMTTLSLRSNLYNGLPTLYGDAGVFATGAMGVFDDAHDLMRVYQFPIGSYWLATDHRGVVDTFMREFEMTVRQVVLEFGDPQAGPATRWAPFSHTVQQLWDDGNYEKSINVVAWVYPNPDYRRGGALGEHKKWLSVAYEQGVTNGQWTEPTDETYLRKGGHDLFPYLCPRWDVTGEDVYGTACPGMEALGTVKELQSMDKRVSKAQEKQLNPPLTGPTSLRTQKTSLLAGDITYQDVREGQQGLRPIHETTLSVRDAQETILKKEQRVSRIFYEDLFLMLANSDRREITAREIEERHEEKLLALGQVLERMNDEVLDPLTDLQFDKMTKAGLVPPAPEELQGQDLRVEYVSIMAQAQKLIAVAGMERFYTFVGGLAAASQSLEPWDKVDKDHAVEEYADIVGVSPKNVRPQEEALATRDGRAQVQAAAAKIQAAGSVAQTAKTLSETDVEGDSALRRMVGQ